MYYFVFTNDDGDPSLRPLTRGDLLKELNEEGVRQPETLGLEWLKENSVECLPERSRIIIKGEVVVPTAKETVVELDVP